MNSARRFSVTGVLAIVCASWAESVFAGQQTGSWLGTIVAQVDNYARISPRDLAEAEQLATCIYEAIGVRTIWVHGEVQVQDPRGLRVRVFLLSREMEERKITDERIKKDVLGQAHRPSRGAYIFSHRIAAVAVKRSQDGARVLGLVIAHEMGHIMLPAHSHSETGIMSADVDAWSKNRTDPENEELPACTWRIRSKRETMDLK
jgi:hypothetical protein